MSGRPGDLQVVPSGVCIQIQYFSRKKQPRDPPGHHGLGINFLYIYTPAGDNSLLHRAKSHRGEGKILEHRKQAAPHLPCHRSRLNSRRDATAFHYGGDHRPGKQIPQGVDKIPRRIFLQIRQQPGVQRFLCKRRLPVDGHLIIRDLPFLHMGGSGKHQGTADTIVGEQHFTLLCKYDFPISLHRKPHVSQGKPRPLPGGFPAYDGNQRTGKRRHMKSRFLCHTVSVSPGACGRVGNPPRGNDCGRMSILPSASGVQSPHGAPCIIQYALYLFPYNRTVQPLQQPFQRRTDIRCPIGHGKHPPAPFRFQRDALRLKKRHHIRRGKAG